MHRHPSRVCVAFVKTKKKKQTFSVAQFIFLSRYLRKKVINTGNDYNVCELRLVEMSIQSTVQGLSSQSSCFDFIDRPNVFSMEVVTFCYLYVLFSFTWICGFNQVTPAKLHPNPWCATMKTLEIQAKRDLIIPGLTQKALLSFTCLAWERY